MSHSNTTGDKYAETGKCVTHVILTIFLVAIFVFRVYCWLIFYFNFRKNTWEKKSKNVLFSLKKNMT